MFNIPSQITQGDRISWTTELPEYTPISASWFIRGASNPLNLVGIADGRGGWDFEILESQSAAFTPGRYQAQFAISTSNGKQTLGTVNVEVCPSFENLTELDTRSNDEIELENITQAINKLASGGVKEYWIGDRKMEYQDLEQLTERQAYLRRRIAIASGKLKPGGRNVGIRFCN